MTAPKPRRAEQRIWLVADDYGISPAVSAAIRDLIARNRINATSVMVAAPSFSTAEAVRLLDVAGRLPGGSARFHAAIGLHVTLTGPFKPVTPGFAPLHDGAFPKLAAMAGRALAHLQHPDLLEAEILGQFDAFQKAFGRTPDYVDGHQHIHVFPQIGEALLRAMKNAAPQAWVRQCGRAPAAPKNLSDPKGYILDALSARFRRLAEQSGVRANPAFAGTYSFKPGAVFETLFPQFLAGLPDGGLIMCHPGKVDDELIRLDPVTTLRECEYAYFLSQDFPRLLAERGYALAFPT
ncbi:MAG TPA: ChbG/HpnK family deacetylase [Xanthobacteraceae bacterium]|nr:ChbG/HpnK family deacetylase [Xanthobacteraceae bacterium]